MTSKLYKMERRRIQLLCLALFLSIGIVSSAQNYTISGKMVEQETGESVIDGNVVASGTQYNTTANDYGFYSLSLPAGEYKLIYYGEDLINDTIEINLQADTVIDIEFEVTYATDVVEFTADEENIVKDLQMSTQKLDIKTIKKVPALLGEVDVVRSLQLLPGVTTAGEGSSGFNVRGGGIDQNLVLLDEAPVYNSSHLFGFFSVFNPDAVRDVTLIKGGIPARYGGRLSSILDVKMKEGNSKTYAVNGGVGLIFSRLSVEGPIKKDKASFIIAGRRSYADVLAQPFLNDDLKGSKFYFYDLTLKGNINLNDKNRIFISGYSGADVFNAGFGFDWGNKTATVRWNHLFSNRMFSNLTAYYSKYDYSLGIDSESELSTGDGFLWQSNIQNIGGKEEVTWYINPNNKLQFGGEVIYYVFSPGKFKFTSAGEEVDISQEDKQALESSVYINNEQKIGKKIQLNYGLRFSTYKYLAPFLLTFDETTPAGESRPRTDSLAGDDGSQQTFYYNFEPRFGMKYEISQKSALKLSYNRTAQYIHLVSNTAASLPTDVWYSSSNNIKPELADQVAVGYFRNVKYKKQNYEVSTELFYKQMQNAIDYIDWANLLFNVDIEGEILYGKGRAYGAELLIRKKSGKLTGWIAYTLSKSERQIVGINNGDWYNSRYDKRHNLNVVSIYQLTKRTSVSSTFTFGTGVPATYYTNRAVIQGNIAVAHNANGARNNFRVPPYHRLDLAVTIDGKKHNIFKKKKVWEGQWVFSCYNVYARKNPFGIYLQPSAESGVTTYEAVRFSVFATAIPSIAYNFKF